MALIVDRQRAHLHRLEWLQLGFLVVCEGGVGSHRLVLTYRRRYLHDKVLLGRGHRPVIRHIGVILSHDGVDLVQTDYRVDREIVRH